MVKMERQFIFHNCACHRWSTCCKLQRTKKKDGHERFGKNCDQIERGSNNDNGQTIVNLSVRHH